tara:strand:- start:481 stop:906 length:426 start_codon:yes stop_codon:yes gene_type:complete
MCDKMRRITKLDRKAWLRIVEAFLAIIIVLGAVLVIMVRQKPNVDISESIYERQGQILDLISKNEELRNEVLIEKTDKIDLAILELVPGNWNYSTNICNITLICPNPKEVYDTEVYSREKMITANLTKYAPKKLRFFVWMK